MMFLLLFVFSFWVCVAAASPSGNSLSLSAGLLAASVSFFAWMKEARAA